MTKNALLLTMILLAASLAATGSAAGEIEPPTDLPPAVEEWMDTSPDWRRFQVAVEDSLQALRWRVRDLEGQLELSVDRLQDEKDRHGSAWERWLLPVAVTLGVIVGAAADG